MSILTTASIAYFCMASDLGYVPIEVVQNGPGTRQFWYVRYIDWVITTPLLLAQILLTAGLPMNIIFSSIFFDIVMVICRLIGGLIPTTYKWAFYAFGCAAMFWVFWNILSGIKSSKKVGGIENRRIYIILTIWIFFFWSIYQIAWGLCEGSNVISVTGEMIFYGILDIFTKPIFALLILFLHRNVNMKKGHYETKMRVEQIKYPQQEDRQDIESISTGYVMASPNLIQIYY
jgi:bacteriorhodopsin